MYHFIEDKEFLGNMRRTCADLVNQLVMKINNDGEMEVRAYLVGSGAKNIETQNADEPVDLDYNLEIVESSNFNINAGQNVKEYIRNAFNEVLNKNGWSDCQDSTSCLTTKQQVFNRGNKTPFSIDLAIVCESGESWYRLIHQKTGLTSQDQWYWNEMPHSEKLRAKVNWLKVNDCWPAVRQTYLDKKNLYLRRHDNNHPSFVCYIEGVNEVYDKYRH